jgi:hypothetical protein
MNDLPVLPCEDEISVLIGVTHQLAFEHLPRGVLMQGLDRVFVERAMIANYGGDYHDDWQRRLRELRERGFDYDFKKRKEDGRFRTTYIVTKLGPKPPYPW